MELYRKLKSSIENRQGVALVTITKVSDDTQPVAERYQEWVGNKLLVWADGRVYHPLPLAREIADPIVTVAAEALAHRLSKTFTLHVEGCEIEFYVEVFPPPLHLIVAGAGHVAKPVVQLAKLVGFYVTVVCDRPQFANSQQFPWADEVVCMPYLDYFRNVQTTRDTYILLITRGHKYDVLILRELLGKPAGYIGMIGSRRRISGVFSQLHREFPEETFENIYAPIGLDIGAQTPEEIAVSILAEVLKVKNGRTGKSLKETVRYFIAEEKEGNGNDRA